MKFAVGAIALVAVGGASAFAPQQVNARSSTILSSTTATPTYTFTKSEEIFAEALEVGFNIFSFLTSIADVSE
jgi:hypothetical protein